MPSLINRLQSFLPDFRLPTAGPGRSTTHRPRPSTGERVPSEWGGVAGRVWFLPYADRTSTGDTAEIRAAMRMMLRDPYVKSAWLTQVLSVLSQDFQVHVDPRYKKEPLAQQQADWVRYCLEKVEGGMVGLGTAVLMNLGADGICLAEKVWRVEEDDREYKGRVRLRSLKPKDPNHLRLIGDEYRNVTAVRSERQHEEYPISDFVYLRYLHCYDEPFGMAAFRAAYGAYWMRDTVRKLRAIHHEKKAGGMLKGEYEDPADQAKLEAALRQAKSSTWLAVPAGVKVEAMDISKAAEADWKSFDESLREEILVGIALAHLHILQGGVTDARGDTKVHKEVSDLGPWLLTYLLQEAINGQLTPDLVDYNYPQRAGLPRVTLGGVTNEEILQRLDVLTKASALGFKPSRSAEAVTLTIQEADPADPNDQLAPPPNPMAMGGTPGQPQPGGFGAFAEGGAALAAETFRRAGRHG
jgi:hypothetical protein